MRRGKKNLICTRPKKSAGGLASAGRKSVAVAGFQIKKINLEDRIFRLTIALKN